MNRTYLLIVTAVVEAGTALILLALPSVLFRLLLGVEETSPEALFVGRITGAALLAIGVACWLGRFDSHSPAAFGLLIGVLIYDSAAAGLLAYAGIFLSLAGIALWPAVVAHAALAGWCVMCFWDKRRPI
jgi:hypothetical protein